MKPSNAERRSNICSPHYSRCNGLPGENWCLMPHSDRTDAFPATQLSYRNAVAVRGALMMPWLQYGIGVQSEMSQDQERLPKGMYRPNDTVCGQSFRKRVVVCLQLNVVSRAIVHFHVTYDRGPMPRFISEGKRRDGIECGKDVPLARSQCPTKGRIKVIFCRDTPGEKLFRLTIAGFAEESLGEGGFDFARICNRVVLIEANDPAEVLNARHIVIGDQRLYHWLP